MWTEAALVEALKSRYTTQEYGLLTQVRDGAGWDRRTFDAIAIGYWSSRGHAVHGFECKVSKSDWKMGFVAQAIKRTLTADPNTKAILEAEQRGYKRGTEAAKSQLALIEAENQRLKERIEAIEEASGLRLASYESLEKVRQYGAVIKLAVQSNGSAWDGPLGTLRSARNTAQRFIEASESLFPEEATS